MRSTGGMALVLCLIVLGTAAGWGQPAPEKPIQCNAAVKSKPNDHSLLGRSEMQYPKPLPAIRELRLQEIPVAGCSEGSRQPSVDIEDASDASVDIRVATGKPSQGQQPQRAAPSKSESDLHSSSGQ